MNYLCISTAAQSIIGCVCSSTQPRSTTGIGASVFVPVSERVLDKYYALAQQLRHGDVLPVTALADTSPSFREAVFGTSPVRSSHPKRRDRSALGKARARAAATAKDEGMRPAAA